MSCNRIADERSDMFGKLCEIPYLAPFKSQANYIMCEVLKPVTSAGLMETLLARHDIYIKDLTYKDGFYDERQYIRLAVKSEKDNSILIGALKNVAEVIFAEEAVR